MIKIASFLDAFFIPFYSIIIPYHMKKEDNKFFIKNKEISLDKVFKQIEKMRTYNREHLKSQIYDSDILKSVLDKLEKY